MKINLKLRKAEQISGTNTPIGTNLIKNVRFAACHGYSRFVSFPRVSLRTFKAENEKCYCDSCHLFFIIYGISYFMNREYIKESIFTTFVSWRESVSIHPVSNIVAAQGRQQSPLLPEFGFSSFFFLSLAAVVKLNYEFQEA